MKKGLIFGGGLLLGVIVYVLFISPIDSKKMTADDDFDVTDYVDISSRTNIITQEEYDFFYEIVSKSFVDRDKKEDIHQETLECIQNVYSQFLIGNHLQVNQPYSYQTLVYDMEQENVSRQLKQENNEVFYGPVQYDLEAYFKYQLNNTKVNIVKKLSEHADEKLVKKAENYFVSQPDRFLTIVSISYEVKQGGKTEQRILYNQEMSTMEKTAPQLFQELYNNEKGSAFEFEENGEKAIGTVLSKEIIIPTFKEVQQDVLKVYITQYVFDHLVSAVGKENPIKLASESK